MGSVSFKRANLILKKIIWFGLLFLSKLFNLGGLRVCRFEPSCTHYAKEAIEEHTIFSGLKLITKRLLKCHPFGSFGYDPVPKKEVLG